MASISHSMSTQYFTPASRDSQHSTGRSLLADIHQELSSAASPADYVKNLDRQFRVAYDQTRAVLAAEAGKANLGAHVVQSCSQVSAGMQSSRAVAASYRTNANSGDGVSAIDHILTEISRVALPQPVAEAKALNQEDYKQAEQLERSSSNHQHADIDQMWNPDRRQDQWQAKLGIPGLAKKPILQPRSNGVNAALLSQFDASFGNQASHSSPGSAQSQTSAPQNRRQHQSPISPAGASAWRAAAEAWRNGTFSNGGTGGDSMGTQPSLEGLLREIEKSRGAPLADFRAEVAQGSLLGAQDKTVMQPNLQSHDDTVSHDDTDEVQLDIHSSNKASARVTRHAAWTPPVWQEPCIDARFPKAVDLLLEKVAVWEALEAASAAEFRASARPVS